jgi:hypothetical protein
MDERRRDETGTGRRPAFVLKSGSVARDREGKKGRGWRGRVCVEVGEGGEGGLAWHSCHVNRGGRRPWAT